MATTTKTTTRKRAAAAGATVPADHAAKAEAEGAPIDITVAVTIDDVERHIDLTITPEDIDDYDAMELLAQNVPTLMFKAIVGDREQGIREALRSENGRLRASSVMNFVMGTLEAVGRGNS